MNFFFTVDSYSLSFHINYYIVMNRLVKYRIDSNK